MFYHDFQVLDLPVFLYCWTGEFFYFTGLCKCSKRQYGWFEEKRQTVSHKIQVKGNAIMVSSLQHHQKKEAIFVCSFFTAELFPIIFFTQWSEWISFTMELLGLEKKILRKLNRICRPVFRTIVCTLYIMTFAPEAI